MKLGFGKKKIISPTALPRQPEENAILNWFPGSRDEKRWLLKLRLDVMTPSERQEVARYVEEHAPKKRTAYILWLVTGLIGGHRYYLRSYFWGLVLLALILFLPLGGVAWWLVEGVRMSTFLDDRTRKITEKGADQIEARHRELAASLKENKDAQTNKENLDLPIEVWFPAEDKYDLQRSELAFMRSFYILMQKNRLSPNNLTVEREEKDGTLVFFYHKREIGRLNLQQKRHMMSIPYEKEFSILTGELDEFLKCQNAWIKEIQEKQYKKIKTGARQ